MTEVKGLTEIKEVFQPLYEQELTDEETFDIGLNLTSFFELLLKIEQQVENNHEENN